MSHKSIAYICMASAILALAATSKIYADAQIVIDPVTQTISIIETDTGKALTGTTSGTVTTVTTGVTTVTTPIAPKWTSTS